MTKNNKFSSPRVIASDSVAIPNCTGQYGLLSLVSLAAKASLSFSAKESNQRKLPAAPASMVVSANCPGVGKRKQYCETKRFGVTNQTPMNFLSSKKISRGFKNACSA